MDSPTADRTRFRFGAYWFRPSTGELGTDARVERLPRKAAQLLEALLARGGAVLTREEIRDLVWPGGKVEFDQGINFLVRQIRKALDETADGPGCIETLPKRGYRMAVEVSAEPDDEPRVDAPARTRRVGVGVAAGLLVLLGAGVVGAGLMAGEDGRPVSGDAGSESDGPVLAIVTPVTEPDAPAPIREAAARVGEALTVDFTAADALRVLGPAATAGLGLEQGTTGRARGELDACLTLSGSVRVLDADRRVLFLQLIRTSDQAHVWARVDSVPAADVTEAALTAAADMRTALGAGLGGAARDCPG